MEPTEISEFSKQMKEAGESSLTRISLAISILAVLVAMVTVLSHRSHTEAVLAEARATDQWNLYQAKNIRSNNLLVSSDLLTLQPTANPTAVQTKLAQYRSQLDKWKEDLAEEQKQAREFEAEVTKAEAHAARYDLGEALLQIAVVLSSITLLTRQRGYVLLGLTIGATGLLIVLSALFIR